MKCPLHFLWSSQQKINNIKLISLLPLLVLFIYKALLRPIALQKQFKVLVTISIIMWFVGHIIGKLRHKRKNNV